MAVQFRAVDAFPREDHVLDLLDCGRTLSSPLSLRDFVRDLVLDVLVPRGETEEEAWVDRLAHHVRGREVAHLHHLLVRGRHHALQLCDEFAWLLDLGFSAAPFEGAVLNPALAQSVAELYHEHNVLLQFVEEVNGFSLRVLVLSRPLDDGHAVR